LKLALGDLGGAIRDLEQARPLVENAPFPDWVGHFRRFELECWLAQDRLRAAVNWADEASQGAALNGRPMHNGTQDEALSLAVARVFMVKGDLPSTERALALLKQLLQSAEAEGRVGVQIEGLALRAVAQWRGGDQKGAMVSLERALHMAEPEGYLRTFADLGIPMARLLQEARSRHVMPEYIATLLTAFRPGMIVPVAAARVLPEPLTAREQEVLRLLAAGLTSREIAETLVISPETVKKHTGSIYGKLGVNNRTEAAARARELDLFDPLP
jgi:LuxR family maltose regulon positive regulatory protein